LRPAVHLAKDLKADDLDAVELVMEIEDSFQISISDEDADRLKTVGDWTGYVRSRVKDSAPGK
jgi:acyl carrier protein